MLTIAIALAAATQAAPAPVPADLPAWVAEVNRRLDKYLVRPAFNDSGSATVTFRRGEDGRPVEISARSSSPWVSRAAVRTVQRIGTLPPMPASMPARQRVTFKFLIGMNGHGDEFEAARKAMMASADTANSALAARFGGTQLAGGPAAGSQVAALAR